jgi:hypothetical protein
VLRRKSRQEAGSCTGNRVPTCYQFAFQRGLQWNCAGVKAIANAFLNRGLRDHLDSLLGDDVFISWRRQLATMWMADISLHKRLVASAITDARELLESAELPDDDEDRLEAAMALLQEWEDANKEAVRFAEPN